jgi:hypothetical protein
VKSAYEDLRCFTLDKIAGAWGKLAYVADRRTSEGEYEHWGFVRVHGAAAAQEAFFEAHRSILTTILHTPLNLLRRDLQESSAAEEVTTSSYVSKLCSEPERLLPSDCSKMTQLHLLYLLRTLSILENRKERNLQSALPSLQPDR